MCIQWGLKQTGRFSHHIETLVFTIVSHQVNTPVMGKEKEKLQFSALVKQLQGTMFKGTRENLMYSISFICNVSSKNCFIVTFHFHYYCQYHYYHSLTNALHLIWIKWMVTKS